MSKKAKAEDMQEQNNEGNQLPLFFQKPRVINPEAHRNAGIKQNQGMNFAKNTNSITITAAEFIEAAKYYPIVFTVTETPVAMALVGLEAENYFVEKNGSWKEGVYVPAYARQYPFIFAEIPDTNKLTLCIDESSVQYTSNAKGDDVRLFDKDSKTTQFTNMALDFCSAVQQQYVQTQEFCRVLQELKLFSPQTMEAKLEGGKIIRLNGFQSIDQEKLRSLPADKVAELHNKGYLALIYFSILSSTNWNNLLGLATKAPKVAK